MSSSEFWFWPISKLAAAYRARSLSPVEVTEAMLGRIENLNPALNAAEHRLGQIGRAHV